MKNKTYKILGLMSGTSMDGLDCCLCDIKINKEYDFSYKIIDWNTFPYSIRIKDLINDAMKYPIKSDYYSEILGREFAKISDYFLDGRTIDLIGSHGQTIQHIDKEYTKQIGSTKFLLNKFNVPVVSNFRENDILAGGNGAPLIPFLDWLLFKNNLNDTFNLNIGGISNLSKVSNKISRKEVLGFDTGPGMSLIDEYVNLTWNETMDLDGKFSKKGKIISQLEDDLLSHPYILKHPPKSTGRHEFGLDLINKIIIKYNKSSKNDIIRTLVSFTAKSICINLKKYLKFNTRNSDFYINGGGSHHPLLLKDLKKHSQIKHFLDLNKIGIHQDNKESFLIAVLSLCRFLEIPSNMSSVTGSKGNVILGDILF